MENTMNAWTKGLLFAVVGTMLATQTQAAEVTSRKMSDGGYAIYINGDINWADSANLANMIKNKHIARARVDLNSDGGLVSSGLEIANIIKDKGFTTQVWPGERCFSVCALIWLGGSTRYVSRAAVIGFHGISYMETNKPSFNGNVEAAKYLLKTGISPETAKTLLTPGHDDIFTLTTENAPKLGINFTLCDRDDTFLANTGCPIVSN
jgi:hypothetical protein